MCNQFEICVNTQKILDTTNYYYKNQSVVDKITGSTSKVHLKKLSIVFCFVLCEIFCKIIQIKINICIDRDVQWKKKKQNPTNQNPFGVVCVNFYVFFINHQWFVLVFMTSKLEKVFCLQKSLI